MSELEPLIVAVINGNEYEMTRQNSRLYTFLGKAAFTHIFIEVQSDEKVSTGIYLFEQIIPDEFPKLAGYMAANQYPMHLNEVNVPEGDIDVLQRHLTASDGDLDIPDDWI